MEAGPSVWASLTAPHQRVRALVVVVIWSSKSQWESVAPPEPLPRDDKADEGNGTVTVLEITRALYPFIGGSPSWQIQRYIT